MIKKPTPNQLRANRENAKKCTGPKTPEGKARVSHNAVMHGFCTRDLILRRADSPEDAAEFEALLAELVAEHGPESLVEHALVESIASCLWRRRRALRFETAAMARQLDLARANNDQEAEKLQRLNEEFEEVRTAIESAEATIDRLKSPPPTADVAAHEQFQEEVHRLVQRFFRKECGQKLIDRLIVCLGDSIAIKTDEMTTIQAELASFAERAKQPKSDEGEVWLPPFEELGKLVRYENMLNRQLHRSLMELRRIRTERAEAKDGRRHACGAASPI